MPLVRYHKGWRLLELAVLGLLKEKPMSGYELQKLLTAKLGAFWRVSFGSLYPCLKRLNAQGALTVLDSPSMSRKKHVYQLTERGELLFQELLESADVHDFEQDRFSLRLAFFRYLEPANRLDQLERRRGYLQQRLRDLRASLRTARDRMDAYTLSLMDHGLEEREREIAWLDRLIANERAVGADDPRARADEATRRGGRRRGRAARAGRQAGPARRRGDPPRPPAPAGGGTEPQTEPQTEHQTEPAPQAPTTGDRDLPGQAGTTGLAPGYETAPRRPAGAVAQTRRISG